MKKRRIARILLALLFVASSAFGQTAIPLAYQANQRGVVLQIYCNPQGSTGPASLTGATATLRVQYPQSQTIKNFSLSVSMDGTYGSYTTQAGDFPIGGNYQFQLISVNGGVILRSPIQYYSIGSALPGSP